MSEIQHSRITIPALLISVRLEEADGHAQAVVDKPNRAALIRWPNQTVIVDHAAGLFANLHRCREGMTAYLRRDGKREKWVCCRVQTGHIRLSPRCLFDENWQPVSRQNDGGLTIYTCKGEAFGGVQDVTLTYWRPAQRKRG